MYPVKGILQSRCDLIHAGKDDDLDVYKGQCLHDMTCRRFHSEYIIMRRRHSMNEVYEKLQKCYESVREKIDFKPKVALVLGSGLGDFAKRIRVEAELDYCLLYTSDPYC